MKILTDQIARIRGMVSTSKPFSDIEPLFDTLTDHAQAMESELGSLKAAQNDAALEKRAKDAEMQQQSAQAALDEAMKEIKRLREEAGEKEWHEQEHQKTQREILKAIAQAGRLNEAQIAKLFAISAQITTYHRERLYEAQFITFARDRIYADPNHPQEYELSPAGRSELARLGLLK